jgi:hypothetical protein
MDENDEITQINSDDATEILLVDEKEILKHIRKLNRESKNYLKLVESVGRQNDKTIRAEKNVIQTFMDVKIAPKLFDILQRIIQGL